MIIVANKEIYDGLTLWNKNMGYARGNPPEKEVPEAKLVVTDIKKAATATQVTKKHDGHGLA